MTVLGRLVAALRRNEQRLVVATVAAVFLAHLAYALSLGDVLRYPDEREYVGLARQLVRTGRYALPSGEATAYRPPGYPFALAPLAAMGDVVGMRLLGTLSHVLTVMLVVVLARRLAPSPAGLFTAVAAGFYPVGFYTAGTLYAQTFSAALLCGAIVIALRLFGDPPAPSWRLAAIGGALLGWLVLTAPTALAAAAVVVVWAAIRVRRTGARASDLAILVILLIVPISAWTVRNAAVIGTPTLGTQTGINLLLGNSPNTTPNSGVNVDLSDYRAEAEGLDEVEKDRLFLRGALTWIRENPVAFARLYVLKFLNFFNYRNDLYVQAEASSARDLLVLMTYAPLLLLVAVRLLLRRRWRLVPAETLALAVYLGSALGVAIFFTRIRFRVPVDYLLAAMAAGVVARLLANRLHGDDGREGRSGSVEVPARSTT